MFGSQWMRENRRVCSDELFDYSNIHVSDEKRQLNSIVRLSIANKTLANNWIFDLGYFRCTINLYTIRWQNKVVAYLSFVDIAPLRNTLFQWKELSSIGNLSLFWSINGIEFYHYPQAKQWNSMQGFGTSASLPSNNVRFIHYNVGKFPTNPQKKRQLFLLLCFSPSKRSFLP